MKTNSNHGLLCNLLNHNSSVPQEELTKAIGEALSTGIALFYYIKESDGSLRRATGTRVPEFIPFKRLEEYKATLAGVSMGLASVEVVKNQGHSDLQVAQDWVRELGKDVAAVIADLNRHTEVKPIDPESPTISYYDFEAKDIRSFKLSNLVAIL